MVEGLSVVLPAYNEEENISPVVSRALEVLPRMAVRYEVIVVNDGSRDRTVNEAQKFVDAHYPRVRLVNHAANLGYGAALRSGFEHASENLIFYTDADNQFDLAELEYFLAMITHHDMVIGFRVYRYDSVLRSMVSWIYNRIVGIMFRVHVRDVDCSYKLFRREVLEKITIDCEDFFVDTELIAKARRWNFRIAEKGVRHYPRVAGETTVQPSDVQRTLKTVFRMWRRIYLPARGQVEESAARQARSEAFEVLPSGKRDGERLLR